MYAIGTMPLGGYVKITGMNPAEEIPPEVAHRAYFRQPVWKRIVVISAGPAVNIFIAFALLAGIYWINGTEEPPSRVASVKPNTPAAAVLKPGTNSWPWTASARRGTPCATRTPRSPSRSPPTSARPTAPPAARPSPSRCRSGAAARLVTLHATPVYDAAEKRPLLGFTFGGTEYPAGPARASELSVETTWDVTSATVTTLAGIFQAEKRKEISGVVGSYETMRQSIEVSTTQALFRGDHLALARHHQPVPVPAARRRPDPPGAGREGAREGDPVQRDGAGRLRGASRS